MGFACSRLPFAPRLNAGWLAGGFKRRGDLPVRRGISVRHSHCLLSDVLIGASCRQMSNR